MKIEKTYFGLILVLMLSCSCTVQPDTISQYYYGSGFAGVDSSTYNITFSEGSDNETIMTKSEILNRIDQSWYKEDITINGYSCKYYEQWGTFAAAVCYEGSKLVAYHEIRTLGNHQKKILLWNKVDYSLRCGRDVVICKS